MWTTSRLILIVLISLSVIAQSRARRVNCRKFVFAPACRGISAKRSSLNVLDLMSNRLIDIPDGSRKLLGQDQQYGHVSGSKNNENMRRILELVYRKTELQSQLLRKLIDIIGSDALTGTLNIKDGHH